MFYFTTECIVYLDFLKNNGNREYEAYIDFRTEIDLQLYASVIGEYEYGENNNTYIKLRNLKTNKRLRSKCYYRLNLVALKQYGYLEDQESSYIWRIYDLEGRQRPIDESDEILQSHSVLEPNELLMTSNNSKELNLSDFSESRRWKLLVRDVGQANWNELLDDDGAPKVVYDLGAPIDANKNEVNNLFYCRADFFEMNKPMLIISHWDIDHYHCLKNLDVHDIRRFFSKTICVNAFKSLTSQRVYSKIVNAIGTNNIYLINPANRTNGINMHRCIYHNNFSLYVGEKSSNINYSGLCLFFRGGYGSVNLTGDLKLSQASDVYRQEIANNLKTQEHILIAPHHGGNNHHRHRLYLQPTSKVIISVGAGNHYGHPHSLMLRYYLNLSGSNVSRTDLNGDVYDII